MDIKTLLPPIEDELRRQIARLDEPRYTVFHEMLTYHMGWSGPGAGPEATGKRIRPLLVLLCAAGAGGDWRAALPAGAAVELVHNFSLVHDDVQDKSDTRRGRPTIWARWGVPMAINVGDALFVIANQAMSDLSVSYPDAIVLAAEKVLMQTCQDLTKGQFLDMSYETDDDVSLEDYWPMIAGKTAALLSTCCQIGALLGGVDESAVEAYRSFGHALGMAFQAQDDILGIWGDAAITGKSSESDLVSGKKSLPTLYGLSRKGEFAQRWGQGPITPGEVPALAETLAREGARSFAQQAADQMTDLALNALREADPQGEAGQALFDLARKLLSREQ